VVEFAERVGYRLAEGTHPQGAGLVVSRPDSVPVYGDVLDVRSASGYGLRKGDSRVFHFLPGCHIGVRRFEIHPGARSSDARVGLQSEVDPTLLCVSGLRAWLADHLPDGPQGNCDPRRILVRPQGVQQVEVRHRGKEVGVGGAAGAGSHLQVVLVSVAGAAADEQSGDLQIRRLGGEAGNAERRMRAVMSLRR
jgi:hypothetical protein